LSWEVLGLIAPEASLRPAVHSPSPSLSYSHGLGSAVGHSECGVSLTNREKASLYSDTCSSVRESA
jgi:hypothetical protein